MAKDNLRRQVAFEAARLMVARDEAEIFRAKLKAARRVYGGAFNPYELPTNREIREQIEQFARSDRRQLHREELGLVGRQGDSFSGGDVSAAHEVDRFHVYQMLLEPLEQVKENRGAHPEGDVLYHSLQVFDLARNALPYDEEFLLAALLHDVGKAIDPREHVTAGLAALNGFVTPRTAWLIEHHDEALALGAGTLGSRCLHRLQASENFDELMLLARCDREGRRRGVPAPDIEEALTYLRDLTEMCGE